MADKITIVLHSGDMDKVYSALIIANGALSMGMEASIFFTFWGLQRLKKGGLDKGPLSKMHMFGLGKWMVKNRMKKVNVASLDRMLNDFKELGGKILACDMTMEIMGLKKEDMREDLISDYCAVGTFVLEAKNSKVNLFI
ncbi:DsrE/DsrF/DrsH-like family protein [Dehalogenimonas etheniformans]|uniref:NAD(FAD)-dependent dehydrogenase n=1 Tax=Dehalogenimonas etheniformans TaxID=1536648 RepID=A0A2P5P785_9CHLR|nr:DsrE/DsrF/DrsH-like family protein [Dehalogenimonas etheniformans]PPD58168.1 NAD(FAD)-dependent dehydrogenase [Dehalogenimonas etheniformans]QNT75577.1 DsrE/DsrF/DrsH-like family protein [Dehalogenimonas etheniformans]